jgi:hypothetical protein
VIVRPDTVVRWHRSAWRRYWSWRSRGRSPGRPRIDPDLAELIRRMTRENPRWGHMRVLGELRKLGFRVSLQTVQRLCQHVPRPQETVVGSLHCVSELLTLCEDVLIERSTP